MDWRQNIAKTQFVINSLVCDQLDYLKGMKHT